MVASRAVVSIGSISERVSSSTFVAQTPPSPVTIACGSRPTGTSATSMFVSGSITPTELGETDARPPAEPPSSEKPRMAATASRMRTAALAATKRRREVTLGAEGASTRRSAERVAAISSPAERYRRPGLLGERAGQDRVEFLGQLWTSLGRRGRLLVDVRPRSATSVARGKGDWPVGTRRRRSRASRRPNARPAGRP